MRTNIERNSNHVFNCFFLLKLQNIKQYRIERCYVLISLAWWGTLSYIWQKIEFKSLIHFFSKILSTAYHVAITISFASRKYLYWKSWKNILILLLKSFFIIEIERLSRQCSHFIQFSCFMIWASVKSITVI
jgi:hypothetical protein